MDIKVKLIKEVIVIARDYFLILLPPESFQLLNDWLKDGKRHTQ